MKNYTKTFLCISISSFALGVISLVFSLVHYKNRPSAAVYSVTRAYRGIRAAQQEEFTYKITTVIFLIIGIVLILGGIIFLVLHFKKKKTSLQLNLVNGTFNNSIYSSTSPIYSANRNENSTTDNYQKNDSQASEIPSMVDTRLKTPLFPNESIIFIQLGAYRNGIATSGNIILTNQRLIFEKKGLLNAIGIGLLSLAGTDYLSIPLNKIVSIVPYSGPMESPFKILINTGEQFKFAFHMGNRKENREILINYITKLNGNKKI